MAENAMVRANQKNAVANTIKAGNKLTDAQKKNFSAAEIAAIRKSVKAGTWRGAKGADTRIHKSPGASKPAAGRARSRGTRPGATSNVLKKVSSGGKKKRAAGKTSAPGGKKAGYKLKGRRGT